MTMDKPADPIVFGPEYPPVADPLSRYTAPASVTCNEWQSVLWRGRAEYEEDCLRQVAEASSTYDF